MIKLGFVVIAWTRHINITSFELTWTDNINIMALREWLCKSDEISHSTMLSTFRSAGYWSTWNIFWKVRVVQKAVRFAPFGCDYCCRISAGEAASEPCMWGRGRSICVAKYASTEIEFGLVCSSTIFGGHICATSSLAFQILGETPNMLVQLSLATITHKKKKSKA